jgi:hypothetical protein
MSQNGVFTDIPRVANPDVCPVGQSEYTQVELTTPFPDGVVRNMIETKFNPETYRIPKEVLKDHITRNLIAAGVLKKRPEPRSDATNGSSENEINVDELIIQDAEEYKKLLEEYCYYEQRYRYALRQFLTNATSRDSKDNAIAKSLLSSTIQLNRKLNAIIEIMNYLAQERVTYTNLNKEAINKGNRDINASLARLRNTHYKLDGDYRAVTTTKEMIRYGVEKNNNVSHQISVWGALNVLAIATIFYIYRST